MTDTRVSGNVQKEAKSRFKGLLAVLAEEKINTIPHISISEIKAPPFSDVKDKNDEDLVRCFVIRAQAPTGEHVRKDKYEMAVYEAFVSVVKEEIGKLANDSRSKIGSALSRRNFQKIRLQIVEMSRARLRTKEVVESVLLPLSE